MQCHSWIYLTWFSLGALLIFLWNVFQPLLPDLGKQHLFGYTYIVCEASEKDGLKPQELEFVTLGNPRL